MNIKQRIFIAVFLAAVVGLLVWYVVSNPINSSGIVIDQQSTDRLTTVNRVMTSLLGKHWSLLLFVLAIMLVIVNVAVYYALRPVTIVIAERPGKILSYTFLVFVTLFGLTVAGIAGNTFLSNSSANAPLITDPNYLPNNAIRNRNKTILIIGALLFIILAVLICAGVYFKFIKN